MNEDNSKDEVRTLLEWWLREGSKVSNWENQGKALTEATEVTSKWNKQDLSRAEAKEPRHRAYAGIGSRNTPPAVCRWMTKFAQEAEKEGLTLRSGGADGADQAFDQGVECLREIYLPWSAFNGYNTSPGYLVGVCDKALALAAKYHPKWDYLTRGAKLLMARNCYQILGKTLDSPVMFVVCWTPGGFGSGGTGQAIRIAKQVNIPILDLGGLETLPDIPSTLRSLLNGT